MFWSKLALQLLGCSYAHIIAETEEKKERDVFIPTQPDARFLKNYYFALNSMELASMPIQIFN